MNDNISPETKSLALGFIGVGWIGRSRMKVLLDHGHQSLMVYETFAPNAEQVLELAPTTALADGPEMIYNHPDIDGVVIATPNAMHAQQAVRALSAGKSVFC